MGGWVGGWLGGLVFVKIKDLLKQINTPTEFANQTTLNHSYDEGSYK